MSLRNRLRAPLVSAVAAALIGGVLTCVPALVEAAPKPAKPTAGTTPDAGTAKAGTTRAGTTRAGRLAAERRAKADGLSRSRAVFARSSYLCMGYKACNKAGMSASGYAAVNDKMYWRMYAGHNCTNYAAYRMVLSGMPNTRPWSGGGNATYWGTSVPQITDRVPAVGAVAWWKANTGPAGSAGHVAYVEKVVSSDEIIISQDSWGGDFSWAVVTKASGNWPSGFVHFNDRKLVNKAAPVISGIAKVGSRLAATAGTWNPTDAKVTYQWFADGTAVAKATKSTFTLTGSRLGQAIRVRTTATKAGYPTKTAMSATTAKVLPGTLASTAAPLVSGLAKVDRTLSVSPGSWNVTPDSVVYQWYADGQPIAGAVSGTLELAPELAGRAITATVTAVRAYYDPVTVTTTATAPVALGTINVRTKPALSGPAKPGQTLTVSPGSYRPSDSTVSIQWLRDGQPVLNATGPTYQVTALDLGARLSSSVTVTRSGYQSTTLTTPPTVRVRVTPRMKVERIRLKHSFLLRLTMSAAHVAPVEGTIRVRIQGGLRQAIVLRNGVARLRVRDLPQGLRAVKLTYQGGPTVERLVKKTKIRMPAPR